MSDLLSITATSTINNNNKIPRWLNHPLVLCDFLCENGYFDAAPAFYILSAFNQSNKALLHKFWNYYAHAHCNVIWDHVTKHKTISIMYTMQVYLHWQLLTAAIANHYDKQLHILYM